jgi:hypothetical protein
MPPKWVSALIITWIRYMDRHVRRAPKRLVYRYRATASKLSPTQTESC